MLENFAHRLAKRGGVRIMEAIVFSLWSVFNSRVGYIT